MRGDRRADAVQLHGHLRRLVGRRHEHQPDRLAARDVVRVGQREKQGGVVVQSIHGVREAAVVRVQLVRLQHFGRLRSIGDDFVDLHTDEFLVGLFGADGHPAAHGDLHHSGDRQRGLAAADVVGQLAIERHPRDHGAIDGLNPQVVYAIVAAHHVEVDVGKHTAEGVREFLIIVLLAAGDAAAVHRYPAASATFGPIADFDFFRHSRHAGVGLRHYLHVRAAGNLAHAVRKTVNLNIRVAGP